MEFLEALNKVWPILLSLVGAVAWLIRIEVNLGNQIKMVESLKAEHAKEIASIKRDADSNKALHQEKFDEVYKMFMGIKEQLARIEGGLFQAPRTTNKPE